MLFDTASSTATYITPTNLSLDALLQDYHIWYPNHAVDTASSTVPVRQHVGIMPQARSKRAIGAATEAATNVRPTRAIVEA